MVDELLSESTVAARGLVNPAAVARLRRDNATGHADNSLQLYALLSLELWGRTFLDRTWRFDESQPAAPDPSVA